ncbi:MAG: aminotransferase class I/II-fold pyridoxal phosphate-dependent enzyme [Sporomusaceae bacterium]|nr:aminotransferase class I/II-fold pyridoxal phosphate-dependent enzyme [Sporomusaceae bacterium]
MIPLMKHTFLHEEETKRSLADFIIEAKYLSMGEQCNKFENAFSSFQKTKHSILFNSGGSANLALLQALKNLGKIQAGDSVGFSALTWSTNIMPIIQMGLTPVPIDCEPLTLNAMSYHLQERIKKVKIKAFFITNALGFTGDLDEIKRICNENNILLIEDNCESLGTKLPSEMAGNFGLAATTSFFVAHHMSTIEGGMVHTKDDELSEMLKIVRANGWDRNLNTEQQKKWRTQHGIKNNFEAKYTFYDLGYNLRPTEITGFLGSSQLKILEENIKIRQKNYFTLEKHVLENPDLIAFKHEHIQLFSSFAFPILCKTPKLRDKYLNKFIAANIEIRPMIAGNIQNQPFYSKYVNKKYKLPGTDFIHQCGFYCGNYPELTISDLETISNCLKKSN